MSQLETFPNDIENLNVLREVFKAAYSYRELFTVILDESDYEEKTNNTSSSNEIKDETVN